MQALITRQNLVTPRYQYKLKKLPMWGLKVNLNEIDFEWPTQEIFDQMQPDVTIKSLEFKDSSYVISSIRVNLSNNQSSPVFENDQYEHEHP